MIARHGLYVLAAVLLIVLLAAPWVGVEASSWRDVFSPPAQSLSARIFWTLRVPRVLLAAVAGAALAVAGAVFQATFRNPLAEPFTLGVSSGAAVAATLVIHLNITGTLLGLPILTLAAFCGAMLTVLLVYGIAAAWRRQATDTLLLAGVSIGFICSATVLLINYLSLQAVTNQTVRWLMGSLVVVGYDGLLSALPLVLVGLGVAWYLRRDFDLLTMGELIAAGRGVHLGRTRGAAYFAAGAMTAAIVAQCGPIAFVGLVVPHMARSLVGPLHGRLLPASALLGAAFLIVCDTVAARLMHWLAGSPLPVPVGVVTNLVGGVFFLYLLLRRRGRG